MGADIVPLIKEVVNPDVNNKDLRPIALLETPLKVIESIDVDQHAVHIVALMQLRQVGFRAGMKRKHSSEPSGDR